MWKSERDPVHNFRDWMLAENIILNSQLEQINAEIKAEIQKAVDFAIAAPYPSPDKAEQDVWQCLKQSSGN